MIKRKAEKVIIDRALAGLKKRVESAEGMIRAHRPRHRPRRRGPHHARRGHRPGRRARGRAPSCLRRRRARLPAGAEPARWPTAWTRPHRLRRPLPRRTPGAPGARVRPLDLLGAGPSTATSSPNSPVPAARAAARPAPPPQATADALGPPRRRHAAARRGPRPARPARAAPPLPAPPAAPRTPGRPRAAPLLAQLAGVPMPAQGCRRPRAGTRTRRGPAADRGPRPPPYAWSPTPVRSAAARCAPRGPGSRCTAAAPTPSSPTGCCPATPPTPGSPISPPGGEVPVPLAPGVGLRDIRTGARPPRPRAAHRRGPGPARRVLRARQPGRGRAGDPWWTEDAGDGVIAWCLPLPGAVKEDLKLVGAATNCCSPPGRSTAWSAWSPRCAAPVSGGRPHRRHPACPVHT